MSSPNPKRGGPGGPPDLEALLREFFEKILKGHSPFSSPPKMSPQLGRLFGNGVSVVVGVCVLMWLISGFYIVDAREQGVVLRMGSLHRTTDSGLQWHVPYPFESVEIVNLTEIRSVEIGYRSNARNRVGPEALMLTEDQNIIDVQLAVQYDIKDASAFLFNNIFTERDAKDIVKQAAETAIREVVGRNRVDFVLNEGRAQIAAEATRLIQTITDRYALGVRIVKVNINDVQPPEPVLAAFDDAVKAGQDKDKLKNEGLAYANEVIPKARGLAARLEQEAQGHRQRVVAQAEGDASRFKQVLVEYNKAPAVTRDRIYVETVQQMLTNSSKVFVDQKAGNSLLYLPLDKLMQQIGQNGTASSENSNGTPAQKPAESVPPVSGMKQPDSQPERRLREVVRGREPR